MERSALSRIQQLMQIEKGEDPPAKELTASSSWILPGKLAAGRFPHPSEVPVLERAGVTLFVTLTEEWESSDRSLRQRAAEYRTDRRRLRFPVPDYGVPEDAPAFALFVERLAEALRGPEVLFVHCMGGAGRTGIVLACLLARHCRVSADEALERVQRAYDKRPEHHVGGRSPEFDHQVEFVRNFVANHEKEKEK